MQQLLPGDKPRALRVLEEAVIKARAMPLPSRVSSLAVVGEWIAFAGNPAGAKKVTEEAMTLAEKLPADGHDHNTLAVGMTAARMAPYDWPRAKAVLDSVKDGHERNRYLAATAAQLASTDLPKAKEVLTRFEPKNFGYAQQGTVRVATRIARTNPDEAVRIVDGISDLSYRIRGYCQVARGLATVDKPRAIALIDSAMKLIADKPDNYGMWDPNGSCGSALYIALSGQRIGHPDVAGLTARALTFRTGTHPYLSAVDRKQTQVKLAAGFALLDPAVGRQLLAGIAPPDEFAKMAVSEIREWMFALAMSDPERAIEVIDMRVAMQSTNPSWHNGLNELSITLLAQDRQAQLTAWCELMRDIDDTD